MVFETTQGLWFNPDPNKKQSIFVSFIKFKILVICLVQSTILQKRHWLQFPHYYRAKKNKSACLMMILCEKQGTLKFPCFRLYSSIISALLTNQMTGSFKMRYKNQIFNIAQGNPISLETVHISWWIWYILSSFLCKYYLMKITVTYTYQIINSITEFTWKHEWLFLISSRFSLLKSSPYMLVDLDFCPAVLNESSYTIHPSHHPYLHHPPF